MAVLPYRAAFSLLLYNANLLPLMRAFDPFYHRVVQNSASCIVHGTFFLDTVVQDSVTVTYCKLYDLQL